LILPVMGKFVGGKSLVTSDEMTHITNVCSASTPWNSVANLTQMLLALESFYILTITFFKVSNGLVAVVVVSILTWVALVWSLFPKDFINSLATKTGYLGPHHIHALQHSLLSLCCISMWKQLWSQVLAE
jgi:hypothetical protein